MIAKSGKSAIGAIVLNPLLAIEWRNVKMFTIHDEEHLVQVLLDDNVAHEIKFNSRKEREKAFQEWLDVGAKENGELR